MVTLTSLNQKHFSIGKELKFKKKTEKEIAKIVKNRVWEGTPEKWSKLNLCKIKIDFLLNIIKFSSLKITKFQAWCTNLI